MGIRFRTLAGNGDTDEELTVEEAQKKVTEEMKDKTRVISQKVEGKENFQRVTAPTDITEKTKTVMSVPAAQGGA